METPRQHCLKGFLQLIILPLGILILPCVSDLFILFRNKRLELLTEGSQLAPACKFLGFFKESIQLEREYFKIELSSGSFFGSFRN